MSSWPSCGEGWRNNGIGSGAFNQRHLTGAYNSCGHCEREENVCEPDAKDRAEPCQRMQCLRRYRVHVASGADGGRCGKRSPQDYWNATNRNTILALGRAADLHADAASEFLYTLTMQSFAQVVNPLGHHWRSCRVPLSNFETCDFYCGIFDSGGYVRAPYRRDSLLLLLGVLQSVLRESGEWDAGTHESLFGRWDKRMEWRSQLDSAGIGLEFAARENGQRRRFQMRQNFQLSPPSLYCSPWSKLEVSSFQPKVREQMESWGRAFGDGRQLKGTGRQLFSDQLGDSARSRHLQKLIGLVTSQVGIERSPRELIEAIACLDLEEARAGEAGRRRVTAKRISQEYNKSVRDAQQPQPDQAEQDIQLRLPSHEALSSQRAATTLKIVKGNIRRYRKQIRPQQEYVSTHSSLTMESLDEPYSENSVGSQR